MRKYLVIQDSPKDVENVGIFVAKNKASAIETAKEQWEATGHLYAVNMQDTYDGWSYYEP